MKNTAKFFVNDWLVADCKDLLVKLFNDGFVFKAEYNYVFQRFEYIMQHPAFPDTDDLEDYHVVYQGDSCKFVKGKLITNVAVVVPSGNKETWAPFIKAAQEAYPDANFEFCWSETS